MAESKVASGREFAEGVGRAFAGAILFALPLLLTMEMWWLGFYMEPWRLVVMIVVFFPLLVALSHFVGFDHTAGLPHDIVHALVAYGVAFICGALVLGIVAVLKPRMGLHEIVGKVPISSSRSSAHSTWP